MDDASGMFPINPKTKTYYTDMLEKFDAKIADKNYAWKIEEILPKVLVAGENAGVSLAFSTVTVSSCAASSASTLNANEESISDKANVNDKILFIVILLIFKNLYQR